MRYNNNNIEFARLKKFANLWEKFDGKIRLNLKVRDIRELV